MSKLEFKPDMFTYCGIPPNEFSYDASRTAQKAFDEWLEKQTVVYARQDRYGWTTEESPLDTHKAYLVCIEDIEECEHKNIKYYLSLIQCKDCNKQLKPKNGWEIAE